MVANRTIRLKIVSISFGSFCLLPLSCKDSVILSNARNPSITAEKPEKYSIDAPNLPGPYSNETSLTVPLGLKPGARFRYAVVNGTSCDDASWENWQDAIEELDIEMSGDGQKTLCIETKEADEVQSFSHTWTLDTTAPSVGQPAGFTLSESSFAAAMASWEPSSDETSGIASHEVLIFAGDNATCVGRPSASFDASSEATSKSINRFTPSFKGFLRFKVRVIDRAGNVSESDCSADIKLRNGLITMPMPFDGAPPQWGVEIADATNDGIADVIFARVSYDSSRGYVGILPGGNPPDPAKGRIYTGDNTGDQFGYYELASLHDLTGDGKNEIIIVSPFADVEGTNNSGALFIIDGADELPSSGSASSVAQRYHGHRAGALLGDAPSWGDTKIGDVTGDGIDDYISCGERSGSLVVLPGGSSLPPSDIITTVGYAYEDADISEDFCSSYEILLGDFNGDNVTDIVSSTYNANINGSDSGYVALFLGGSFLPASGTIGTIGYRYLGRAANSSMGVLDFHDIDGDGKDDLLINESDRVIIVPGTSTPPANNTAANIGTSYTHPYLHSNLKKGRIDLNLDGDLDYFLADRFADTSGRANSGSLYVVMGGTIPTAGALASVSGVITIDGELASDNFGKITIISDLTNDGNDDLIVGAKGTIHVIPANSGITSAKVTDVPGARTYRDGTTNFAVHSYLKHDFHDVTGDEVDDLIFWGHGDSIVVIPGGASLPTTGAMETVLHFWQTAGEVEVLRFGDIDGDGIDDIIAACGTCNTGAFTSNGAITIINGGGSMPANGTLSPTFAGSITNAKLGHDLNVSDIDGDGKIDVLASLADDTTGKERLMIYLGAASFGDMTGKSLMSEDWGDSDGLAYEFHLKDITGDNKPDAIVISDGDIDGGTANGGILIIPNEYLFFK